MYAVVSAASCIPLCPFGFINLNRIERVWSSLIGSQYSHSHLALANTD